MKFLNRQEAGKQLARAVRRFKDKDTVVIALPRGGVVLGAEIAKELEVPLGIVLVRKIGHPSYDEYAIGAMVEGEEPVYNQSEASYIDEEWLIRAEDAARSLIDRRKKLYFGDDIEPPEVNGKTIILVDDGIATGLTMQAAVMAMRNKGAEKIVVAVPVAPVDSINSLQNIADEVVVLDKPESFKGAVGAHYHEFEQVDDEEVRNLLRKAANYESQARQRN